MRTESTVFHATWFFRPAGKANGPDESTRPARVVNRRCRGRARPARSLVRNRLFVLRRVDDDGLLRPAEALDLEAARDFGLRFLEHDLPVELGHLLVLLLRLARAQLLFTRVLGDALLVEVRLLALRHGFGVELQAVRRR